MPLADVAGFLEACFCVGVSAVSACDCSAAVLERVYAPSVDVTGRCAAADTTANRFILGVRFLAEEGNLKLQTNSPTCTRLWFIHLSKGGLPCFTKHCFG